MDKETIRAKGTEVVGIVKRLIEQGTAKRIVVKNSSGKVLLNIPVTVACAGALLAPFLAGIAFVVGLVKECSIEIERKED